MVRITPPPSRTRRTPRLTAPSVGHGESVIFSRALELHRLYIKRRYKREGLPRGLADDRELVDLRGAAHSMVSTPPPSPAQPMIQGSWDL